MALLPPGSWAAGLGLGLAGLGFGWLLLGFGLIWLDLAWFGLGFGFDLASGSHLLGFWLDLSRFGCMHEFVTSCNICNFQTFCTSQASWSS